jgi:hypothetical protein
MPGGRVVQQGPVRHRPRRRRCDLPGRGHRPDPPGGRCRTADRGSGSSPPRGGGRGAAARADRDAAYYVVSEALTNNAKHAHATVIDIDIIVNDDVLRIRVCDGARLDGGTGLLGLRDRVETLGGRLRIQSPAGGGTTVEAELPHPTTTR